MEPQRVIFDETAIRFVHLSFEGPDAYSHAGGLAIRVTTLAKALAEAGALVDLYFVGDPLRASVETTDGVTLHRWCQAISATAPAGVYDQDERKIEELCRWLPQHIADLVSQDHEVGRRTVVLAEDWHTAWPLIAIHDELTRRGLREHVTLAWTANNRFGFDRIDFTRLAASATLLTISRAMKHLMWLSGVNPLVVPNGIPDAALTPVSSCALAEFRRALDGRVILAKVGRWDLDKRWKMALETVADLQDRGDAPVLLARGWNGTAAASAHYRELRAYAEERGLSWMRYEAQSERDHSLIDVVALAAEEGAAIVELAFPVEGAELQLLYAGSDAVLANSGFEPFGLVGLEAMAAGSVVVTGSTGEDYISPFHNGFALDTDEPLEIIGCLDWLHANAERDATLRRRAKETAERYRWMHVIERLALALNVPFASFTAERSIRLNAPTVTRSGRRLARSDERSRAA